MSALREAFLEACALDVAVRKPGNVSHASPGHGMDARMFIASAAAAVGPLTAPGASVGERIEGAVAATWAVAGCNTNLGIVLLCAPIAAAMETRPAPAGVPALHSAIGRVLEALDIDDARAAFRAIARARPGGLGRVDAEDVHAAPSIDLRAAMALAADRDRIAAQYRDAYADVFGIGLAAIDPDAPLSASVQRVYLSFLAAFLDSHIVRKHGEALAHTVMKAASPWRERSLAGEPVDADPAFADWDTALKALGINPGTTADLTVAALVVARLGAVCAQG